jgi:hypothetical protein
VNAGEPVIVRSGNRLLVTIRGRGPAAVRQHLAVSDDLGQTWRTELSNVSTRSPHSTLITHPFAMIDPRNPEELIAVTIERPLPAKAELWRGNPKTLAFEHIRTLLQLPKIEGDPHTDFGYPWLLPISDTRALLFYYHGQGRGYCPIWVAEINL